MKTILSYFHFSDPYNLYWAGLLGLLFLSTLATVVLPSRHASRTHNDIRLTGEYFARVQFAFIIFLVSVFLSGHFPDEMPLFKIAFGALLFLSILFYGIGLPLTSAGTQTRLIDKSHACTEDEDHKCTRLPRGTKGRFVKFPITAFFLSLAVAAVVVGALTPPAGADRRPVTPARVDLKAVLTGRLLFSDTPALVHDHIYKLEDEIRFQQGASAGRTAHPIAILISDAMVVRSRFRWRLLLKDDFKDKFALIVRAAYVQGHAEPLGSFRPVRFHVIGEPPYGVVADIPSAATGDQVLLVVRLDPRKPQAEFLKDATSMFNASTEGWP